MYEAGYYICLGFTVQNAEAAGENKKVIGKFSFSGEGLSQAQIDYFNGEAMVNLLDFRRAYSHLSSVLRAMKREGRLEGRATLEGGQI
jgi:hypothetical protein